MQKILPYHEVSVSLPDGRKIIRLIECEMGDEFHTGNDEFTFIWLFPGTGAFAFDSGTNFMMGNDFMYVNGGRYIKFDDFLTDSKFIMLIVDKAGFADFFCMHSYSFVSCDDIHRLLDSVSSDSPYLVHYPASRRLIRAADLIISDFNDITNPRELAVIDTMRFFNSLANLSDKEYGPLYTASKKDPALYAMKRVRENYRTITLDRLSKEMNYSAAYISRSLKELLGMGFEQLVAYRRYIVGIGLLERSGLTRQQVASELGFETYAGFYKFWKKQTGLSPEQYRKNARIKVQSELSPSELVEKYIVPRLQNTHDR